ncbi:MAG: glycosyltransferase family 39 protein, partial [Verrucomicrobium sp.]
MHLRFMAVFGILAVVFAVLVLFTGSGWRNALRALEGMEKVKSQDLVLANVHWGFYWGFVVNAVLATGLALTAGWWGKSRPTNDAPSPSKLMGRQWLWLLLILGLAGGLRWARLDLSLYNDEAHNFRRYFAGYFQDRPDGTQRWREPSWVETLWLNKVGNNSTPFSAMARLGYTAASKWTGAPQGSVLETGLRLPAWIAGMASLLLLWMFMRRLMPDSTACWWFLLFASLHPWHVRYSSEARGYGFLVLGVSAVLYFTLRAWQENKWRWWLLMGVAQFFSIWSFSGSLYYFVAFNGALLAGWTWSNLKRGERWSQAVRPLVGMTLGAMLTIPLMLPMLPQLLGALKSNTSIHGHMGAGWWADVLGNFAAGIRWNDGDAANPLNLAIARFLSAWPFLWLVVAAYFVIVAAGGYSLSCRHGFARVILFASPLAVCLSWYLMGNSGNYIHLWYLVHSLPGWLMVLAVGAAASSQRWLNIGLGVGAAVVLLCWFGLDLRLATQGKENLRGVAQAVPQGAFHVAAYSDVDIYDRNIHILEAPSQLDPWIAEAKAAQRPFYFS